MCVFAWPDMLYYMLQSSHQEVFYQLEVGGSEVLPQGERGVVYFQAPSPVGVVWQNLSSVASKVGYVL